MYNLYLHDFLSLFNVSGIYFFKIICIVIVKISLRDLVYQSECYINHEIKMSRFTSWFSVKCALNDVSACSASELVGESDQC